MLKRASVRSNGQPTPYWSTDTAGLNFKPTSIAGLKAWLRADGLSLSDGNAVTTWIDYSGNGYSPTQATSGKRPTFKENIVNGLPVVRFDGSDDFLSYDATNTISTGASAVTLFIVCSFDSFASYPELVNLDTTANSGTDGYQFIAFNDGGMYCANDGGLNERYTASSTLSTGTFYVLTYKVSGSAFSSSNPVFYKNGTQQSSTRGTGTSTPNIGTHKFRIGANVEGTPAQLFDGDMAEVVLYNSALSDANRTLVENYLKNKYAIS